MRRANAHDSVGRADQRKSKDDADSFEVAVQRAFAAVPHRAEAQLVAEQVARDGFASATPDVLLD